jgi:SAM-dependent methyltransferase
VTLRDAWHRFWFYRRHYWLGRRLPVALSPQSPLAGQGFIHTMLVRGQLRLLRGEPVRVTCALGRQQVAEWTVGAEPVSYSLSLPTRELPVGRWRWLRFRVHVDGRARLLESIPVRRVGAVPRMLARQQYGAVWDGEVHNLESARVAVAGYSDEAEWQRSGADTARNVRDLLTLDDRDVVLEIGCGAARVGVHLAPQVRTWIGCDVSSQMLRFAREALEGYANVRLHQLNGYDLHGIESASVDAVYCTAVFMHLEEWDRYRYVTEAARVLRPGGRLYIDNFDLTSRDGWRLFLDMAALDPAVRPPNVSKASTERELTWYAEQAGLTVTDVQRGDLFVTVVARK